MSHIVKATRRMYAALQHRAAPDRQPLTCWARDRSGALLYRVTVQVKTLQPLGGGTPHYVLRPGARKAAVTRFIGIVLAMYPEAYEVGATFDGRE